MAASPDFFFLFRLSFSFSPLCNFSIQTYLWFGHRQIYILVFNDQLYVTGMSNCRVREELWSERGERISLRVILDARQRNFMAHGEEVHFLIPPGEISLVLAFTNEPKQIRALQRCTGIMAFSSALSGVFFFF